MGGAFLSQPITTKVTNKYQHNKIRVVTCEMQGIFNNIKVGEKIWRMQWSFIELANKYFCSLYLMVMEECKLLNLAPSILLNNYPTIKTLLIKIMN